MVQAQAQNYFLLKIPFSIWFIGTEAVFSSKRPAPIPFTLRWTRIPGPLIGKAVWMHLFLFIF